MSEELDVSKLPKGTWTYVDELPDCDFCRPGRVPAYADGRTGMGAWANMCERHHREYGVGLGTGKGQRLVVRPKADPLPATLPWGNRGLALAPAQEETDPRGVARWPKPLVPAPSMDELEEWTFDGVAEATDGCPCDPDGCCEHGHPSWLLVEGLI